MSCFVYFSVLAKTWTHFNYNRLQGKIVELIAFMTQNNIVVATVPDNAVQKDRTRGNGEGIEFVIHNTVRYRGLDARDQWRNASIFGGI